MLLLASCVGDSSVATRVTTTSTSFPGASLTGSWRGVDGKAFSNVRLELTEGANGAVSGTWSATFVPCTCAVSGTLISSASSRKQEIVTLRADMKGFAQVDVLFLVGTMIDQSRLDLFLDAASSNGFEDWGEPLTILR
ncbi:MAG: hypothetical protein JWO05_3585 [Gemmatimonadetes bacterium]|nr:hypothetical protein [Gemmatimonadota bacterium]